MQKDIQTSESRPITVSWIVTSEPGSCAGQVGLCFCPGKRHTRGSTRLERDLDVDLRRLREQYHITCVVCLLNDAELRSYSIRDYRQAVQQHNLEYIQYAIVECAAPEDMVSTSTLVDDLVNRFQRGQVIAIHCRGGVGRAGLIGACLLLRLGIVSSAEDAIKEVRRLRCKAAVETRKQEDFIAKYKQHLDMTVSSREDGVE